MAGGWQSFRGRLYVLLLGAAVAALAWAWQFEDVPPDLVENLSTAAGLRPPSATSSLLWQHVAAPLCRNFGVKTAEMVLRAAGHVSLGVLAVLSVVLFEMLLPASLRRGEHVAGWWRVWVRFVLFQGAVIFCCSNPVWNAFRWFSPATLQTLLVVLTAICVVSHFKSRRRAPLYPAFALLGLLAADTPVGAVIMVGMVVLLYVRWRLYGVKPAEAPQENPLANALLPWRLTISFAAGALTGAVLEICAFGDLGGLEAFGWTWGDYALEVPIHYIKTLMAACSPAGALIFVVIAVCPVLTELRFIGRATDDEKQLSYFDGLMFLLCGLVALSQLSGASPLWFWTWAGGEHGCVHDDVLKGIAMFMCSLAVIWALAVFTIELFMRNFRRVATLRFQDAAEAEGAEEALASVKRLQRAVRAIFLLSPVLLFGCVVPFRVQGLEREMLAVVADAARETAEECRDVEWLFTDGGLDAMVELAAAEGGRSCSSAEGRTLRALSMMGGVADPRELYLRTRGVTNAEDRALLESGAADALRMWVRTRPDKAKSYAVQIGFELWRRDGRPMPECSGLVARPDGFSPEEAARGAEAGRALARRVLAIYERGSPEKLSDRLLRNAFVFVQWRLAVLARHRANASDARGQAEPAMEDTRLADALDRKNGALARIKDAMAWASKKKLERMTPREGLQLGLGRADYALARVFALRVLDVAPDDPAANFALGMDFFVQRQYSRAEAYLKRCLVERPMDPAVLNNLAQCRLRQGDPAGALPYAKRAIEVLPDSPEIKRTLERIKAASNSRFTSQGQK